MSDVTRRKFMKRSAITAAGAAVAAHAPLSTWAKPEGANDDIRIGVVGFRGKGRQHIEMFRKIPGVRVVALCDADAAVMAKQAQQFEKRKEKVATYQDLRELLDDKDVDAVVTATPNHWHSLLTVWACQAGKDVYVEKPVSHELCEGRRVVEAARKYDCIVQHGTQSRSRMGLCDAFKWAQEGNLGKIVASRGFCYKRRGSIGKVSGAQAVPESVDYDLWCGPAPKEPLMRRRLHYDWHWVWATGNGDIGNQGIHEMDICRWQLGQDKIPLKGMSIGGRFGYDDDGETPNTQIGWLEYEDSAPVIFEVRGLPMKSDMKAMDHYRGIRVGNVLQCENGYIAGGRVYDNDRKEVKRFSIDGAGDHQKNFIKAVRSRKQSDLNAEILEGHLSCVLFHIANISYRIGQRKSPDEIRERMQESKEALDSCERFKEHAANNGVDVAKDQAVLGPWLKIDRETERFVGPFADEANKLITRDYHKPFAMPEKV